MQQPLVDGDEAERFREAADAPAMAAAPDCSLARTCPDLRVDPARCIDDPALFEITVLGEVVSDVGIDDDHLEALALDPGRWFTIVPDAAGGCQATLHAFDVAARAVREEGQG